MKNQKYTQCELTKQNRSYITYIPSKFAILGETLKINGNNGWKVSWKSNFEIDVLPNSYTIAMEHKRNTGDSLPKCHN